MAKGACMPRRANAVTSGSGSPSSANVRSAGAGAERAAVRAISRVDAWGLREAPADERPTGRPEVPEWAGRLRAPPPARPDWPDRLDDVWNSAARGRRACSGKEKLHQRL